MPEAISHSLRGAIVSRVKKQGCPLSLPCARLHETPSLSPGDVWRPDDAVVSGRIDQHRIRCGDGSSTFKNYKTKCPDIFSEIFARPPPRGFARCGFHSGCQDRQVFSRPKNVGPASRLPLSARRNRCGISRRQNGLAKIPGRTAEGVEECLKPSF